MALTLRGVKGSALSYVEGDANFSGLADGSLLTGIQASSGSNLVGFLQAGTGAASRTVQSKGRDILSVKDFGAIGNGAADDSVSFQAAIDYLKAHAAFVPGGVAGSMYVPPGEYLITKSLNFTSLNSLGHGFSIFGSNPLNTIINSDLTEAYPVFDFLGNGNTVFENISIRQQSGCLATCGVFYGPVGASEQGYSGQVRNVLVVMATCPGIVNAACDLMVFDKVYSEGTYGLVTGAANPLGITSKYATLFANTSNLTLQTIKNGFFVGGIPLWLTGAVDYEIDATYCAPTFATSPIATKAAVLIDTSYSSIGTRIKARGLRTENQTASGGQNVINAIALVKNGSVGNTVINFLDIDGTLEVVNASGAQAGSRLIYSDANSTILDLKVRAKTSYVTTYPVLELLGNVSSITVGSIDIDIPLMTLIGTITNKTGGRVRLAGQFPASAIAALSSVNPIGEMVSGSGYGTASHLVSDWAVYPNAPGVVAGEVASVVIPSTTNSTYTGGSGAQAFITFSVPAGIAITSGRAPRHLTCQIFGNISAACTFDVIYDDGAGHTLTSDTFTSGTGKYSLRIHVLAYSTTAIEGYVEVNQTGQYPFVWLGNSGTILPTAAFTIKLRVTSASSNPLNFFAVFPGLLA